MKLSTVLVLKDIKKEFHGATIFENIHLSILTSQMIAIKGKSGIGKSTL